MFKIEILIMGSGARTVEFDGGITEKKCANLKQKCAEIKSKKLN